MRWSVLSAVVPIAMAAVLICLPASGQAADNTGPGPVPDQGSDARNCAEADEIRFRGYTARLENDLFAKTDRDYTNGVSLAFVSRDLPHKINLDCVPWPVRLHAKLIRKFDPGFWRGDEDGELTTAQNVVVKFGQSMYTPADPLRSDLIVDDRPYAGLLYLGFSWNRRRVDAQRRSEMLDTREITVGVIGPLSFARQTQDFVHNAEAVDKFRGWDHQLGNELALQLALERKYRDFRGEQTQIAGFGADAIRSYGLRLGNIETSASLGIEGRFGWNMPNDFGSYPIRPGAENRAPSPQASNNGTPIGAATDASGGMRAGMHVFGSLEAKAVAHDFSIDGNLFRSSHHVTRRPFVGQAAFGFSIQAPIAGFGVRLSVMRVLRSYEFVEQVSRHAFGSIALSFEFR